MVDGVKIDEAYAQGPTACGVTCSVTIPGLVGAASIPNGAFAPLTNATSESSVCSMNACYFVLGDNRQNSSDSRQGWLVPVDNIIGYVDVES